MISDEDDAVEKQAVAWFTRMNGRPSDEDRKHFGQWLAASPVHQRAYDKLRAMWSDLDALADMPAVREDAGLAGLRAKIEDRRRRARRAASGMALGLAVLLAGSWLWLERPHFLQDFSADYVAPRGEMRSVSLSDGSTLLLDADSAVAVAVDAGARHVTLLRGTVFFTVRPSEVPFVVTARNGAARVLGTAFEVGLREDSDVSVTLDSGSLRVDLTDREQQVVLHPGESVDYGTAGLGEPHPVDLEEAGAWRQGRFIFTNARLGDVLERIGRYRDGRIVILGSQLAETRVSGNIALRDTDAALAAVRASVGFGLHRIGRLTLIGP